VEASRNIAKGFAPVLSAPDCAMGSPVLTLREDHDDGTQH
jgi:hypothetical protein